MAGKEERAPYEGQGYTGAAGTKQGGRNWEESWASLLPLGQGGAAMSAAWGERAHKRLYKQPMGSW